MANVLRSGIVTQTTADGVWCEIPEIAPHQEFGPMEIGPFELSEGDRVLICQMSGMTEDFVVICPLVLTHTDPIIPTIPPIPPFPPTNSFYVLYYENTAARTAASLTLVSGLTTWLDDEHRLEIYTDEGTPHWEQFIGFNASGQAVNPAGYKLAFGNTAPTAVLDVTSTASTDPVVNSNTAADTITNKRFTLLTSGKMSWGAGSGATDATFQRISAGGLRLDTILGINADPLSTAQLYIEHDTASKRGLKIKNTGSSGALSALFSEVPSATAAAELLGAFITGESNTRFSIDHSGLISWGSGSASLDTNLYRSAANVLKTDDSLIVAADLTVSGNAVITGTFSRPGILVDFGTPSIATGGSPTILTPSTAPKNNYGMWTSGTNITIPKNGEYEIGGVLRFASQATTVGIRHFRITLNGADEMLFACPTTTQQNSTNTIASGVHHGVYSSGDVITIGTFQNSGASLNLVTGSRAWVRMMEG